jgi:hypothetical protein
VSDFSAQVSPRKATCGRVATDGQNAAVNHYCTAFAGMIGAEIAL